MMNIDRQTFLAANAIVSLDPTFEAFVLPNSRLPEGITFIQLRTLYLLQNVGTLTMSEIASHHRVTKQHMSQTIPIMEEAGLVARSKREGNRKNVYVSITEKGSRFLEDYSYSAVEHFAQLLKDVDPEDKEQIIVSCRRLQHAMNRVLERTYPLMRRGSSPAEPEELEEPTR